MRTKHIFSTLMLAAFAAACSNEELELANNSNELAEGRFEIGQVELTLGDGVDSRYAVGPNFNDLTAEVGDELGAALIDTWNGTTDDYDFKYDYSISDYIHTNYSFKYNGEKWASEAKMVEGNYFFYAPYNAAHVTRSAVTAKFNPVQQLALNADGAIDELSTIKELEESGEVMAVGYKFISREDGKTVNTSLLPIYAYPLITLKNDFTVPSTTVGADPVPTDLVIKQIVISGANIPTEATFNFGDGDAVETEEGVVAQLRDFTYWKDADHPAEASKGGFAKNNGAQENYTAKLLNDATKYTSAVVVKAPVNYTLKAGSTTKFHVIMPAAEYEDLTIELYTDKGVFKLVDGALNLDFAAGKRYDRNYYNADGTLKSDDEIPTGENLNFTTGTEIAGTSSNIVTSASDLAAVIQNFKADDENGNALNVTPLTDDVKIDAAVMTAIKAKTSGFTLNVTAPATISTNLNSSNKNIVFGKGAVIESGAIAINQHVKFCDNLTVKDGTVTINAVFDNAKLVVKDGEVTLNATAETTVEGGELTIGEVAATGGIVNKGGKVTFVAVDKDNIRTYTNRVHNHEGTLTVPEFTVLTSAIANGQFNTNGTSKVVVKGEVTSKYNLNGTSNTVEIYGKAKFKTNEGTIKVMSSDADVTVEDNDAGEIDNTNNGTVNAEGVIYYEFTENVNGKLVVKSSNYNTIILNKMTWAPEADQTLAANVNVVMKDATIEIWDEVTITVDGALTAENSTNGMSYIKGVAGAYVIATNHDGDVAGIKETGAQAVAEIPGNETTDDGGTSD